MTNVKELVKEIRSNLSQVSSSQKDEVQVMRTMLNDREYKVDVYGKDGKEGEYCPSDDARSMISSVISSTTKISAAEAVKLANEHEFTKSEATSMIGISKEFINTFVETGRKLPLGGRKDSNVALAVKDVETANRTYPKRVGVNEDGTARIEKATVKVPAHKSIKVFGPCPNWK